MRHMSRLHLTLAQCLTLRAVKFAIFYDVQILLLLKFKYYDFIIISLLKHPQISNQLIFIIYMICFIYYNELNL